MHSSEPVQSTSSTWPWSYLYRLQRPFARSSRDERKDGPIAEDLAYSEIYPVPDDEPFERAEEGDEWCGTG